MTRETDWKSVPWGVLALTRRMEGYPLGGCKCGPDNDPDPDAERLNNLAGEIVPYSVGGQQTFHVIKP